MTPAERHRAGVFELWGPACYFRGGAFGAGYGLCRGELQAAHWLSRQTLKHKQSDARLQVRRGIEVSEGLRRLIDADLEELLADPRNGVPACEHHHATLDLRNGKKFDPPPSIPFTVLEFATELDLDYLLVS